MVEATRAEKRAAEQARAEEHGRQLVALAAGLPLHIWREFPLLHVVTGSGFWHLAPVSPNGRNARSQPLKLEWTRPAQGVTPEEILAVEELVRMGTMADGDLRDFPAEKLDLPLWSSRTLCGRTWARVATSADKSELLATLQETRHANTALCGRCSA